MQKKLLSSAEMAMKNSYSPYSGFAVGSAVLCEDGKVFCGTNVENASYGLTICAERVAIFNAVSSGCRRIDAVAVVAKGVAFPCGACLQVIAEFADENADIIVKNISSGKIIIKKLKELLPEAFKLKDKNEE